MIKSVGETLIVGAIVGISCLFSHAIGETTSEPTTNTIIPLVRSPLIFKGLHGPASGYKPAGNPSANAITSGLLWLRDAQNKDGSWGNETNGASAETGLALLAFFARGETPSSPRFGSAIERGLKFLVARKESTTGSEGKPPAFGHAISTWAVCEAYSLTRIPMLRPLAEDKLLVILKGQRPSGLWDSSYRTDGGDDDTEASVWQVLALKGGLMGGVMDEKPLREGLRRSADAMKTILATQPDTGTVAGAVLCLQLCGEGRSPVSRSALKSMESLTPDWDAPSFKDPMFGWHLATQAFLHEGAQPWVRWNRLFNPMLVEHQLVQTNAVGEATGYWNSPGVGERYGRTYSTALALLMLEVYQQRCLPTYQPAATVEDKDTPAQDVEIHVQ